MRSAQLGGDDVCGAVAAINFTDMTIRFAFTTDFQNLAPVEYGERLSDLTWLTPAK